MQFLKIHVIIIHFDNVQVCPVVLEKKDERKYFKNIFKINIRGASVWFGVNVVWKKPNGNAPKPNDIWKLAPSPNPKFYLKKKLQNYFFQLSFFFKYSILIRLLSCPSRSWWYCVSIKNPFIKKKVKENKIFKPWIFFRRISSINWY